MFIYEWTLAHIFLMVCLQLLIICLFWTYFQTKNEKYSHVLIMQLEILYDKFCLYVMTFKSLSMQF